MIISKINCASDTTLFQIKKPNNKRNYSRNYSNKPNSSSHEKADEAIEKRHRALEEMERERQKYAQSRGGRNAGPRFGKVFRTRALTLFLRPPPFSFECRINHPPYNNRISNERALRVADIARARASDHRQVNRGNAMHLLYKSGLRRNR